VARSGTGLLEASMADEPSMRVDRLRDYGPALYAPLVAGEEHLGSLLLLRGIHEREFTEADLTTAQTFAGQAAVALQLADGRRRAEEAEVLEDRARIARDLHDLVVQELFAMGMRLSRLREELDAAAQADIDGSLESLDRVVRQIRTTIRALHDPHDGAGPVERVHREANRARATLALRAAVEAFDDDGNPLDGEPDLPPECVDDLVAVVRETLSNAARHGKASRAKVTLVVCPHTLSVRVEDNGRGLPDVVSRRSGLDNLAERARRHGGSFSVVNQGEGALVTWEISLV
jgi:signal transduction histidine kinase